MRAVTESGKRFTDAGKPVLPLKAQDKPLLS
jgi:hypothetical protein